MCKKLNCVAVSPKDEDSEVKMGENWSERHYILLHVRCPISMIYMGRSPKSCITLS